VGSRKWYSEEKVFVCAGQEGNMQDSGVGGRESGESCHSAPSQKDKFVKRGPRLPREGGEKSGAWSRKVT